MKPPHAFIAGVDEAGRGPLAGPVVVAAVILKRGFRLPGLDDSKRVTPEMREWLYPRICRWAVAWSVIEVSVEDIDRLNILQATLLGMRLAVESLTTRPTCTLVDGDRAPQIDGEVRTIIGGDGLEPAISAASILAKVSRDRRMTELHEQYPQYRFDQHKGYSTPDHLRRLQEYGACAIHRRSFAPVRIRIAEGEFSTVSIAQSS